MNKKLSAYSKKLHDISGKLHSISGSGSNDIWACGEWGTLLHYDGTNWSQDNSATKFFKDWDIKPRLNCILVISSTDIWVSGGYNTLLHYDGTSWTKQDVGEYAIINDMWGSSGTDIWASLNDMKDLESGTYIAKPGLIHYNGTSWTRRHYDEDMYFTYMWGSSSTDIWAAGHLGELIHYNGTSWTKHDIAEKIFIYSIWGSSSTDIWACGDEGKLFHYDGISWKEHHTGIELMDFEWESDSARTWFGGNLNCIWGSSSTDIWACGYEGALLHYDGISWTKHHSGIDTELVSIWGSSSTDIWACGYKGVLLHYDGTSWTKHDPFDADCTS